MKALKIVLRVLGAAAAVFLLFLGGIGLSTGDAPGLAVVLLVVATILLFFSLYRSPAARAESKVRRQVEANVGPTAAEQTNCSVRAKNKQNLIPVVGIAVLTFCLLWSVFQRFSGGTEVWMNDGSSTPRIVTEDQNVTPQPTSRPLLDPTAGMSLSQKNAYRSAQSYLRLSGFSEPGLIKQLQFEGYSTADAVAAIERLAPDWDAEALESAQSYLRLSAFSKSGLAKQLQYEGYTDDQIIYGVENSGADWYVEAVESAETYLRLSSFSRDGLAKQLRYEGFTEDQISYALLEIGY